MKKLKPINELQLMIGGIEMQTTQQQSALQGFFPCLIIFRNAEGECRAAAISAIPDGNTVAGRQKVVDEYCEILNEIAHVQNAVDLMKGGEDGKV